MLLKFNELIDKHNLKIRGVIHIGAHHGQEWNTYNDHNIENFIFFEPLKDSFKKLKENINSPKAKLVNLALGQSQGKVMMNVESANQGQSSSILTPKMHLKQYPHITFDQKEEVNMTTLDLFYEQENIPELDFNLINIDVQGYELEVFKGSAQVLEKIDYIIAEVNRAELYENCASVIEIDDYLSTYGFKRVETNWEGVTWGDALYVKPAPV